jgi:hypothetical protein
VEGILCSIYFIFGFLKLIFFFNFLSLICWPSIEWRFSLISWEIKNFSFKDVHSFMWAFWNEREETLFFGVNFLFIASFYSLRFKYERSLKVWNSSLNFQKFCFFFRLRFGFSVLLTIFVLIKYESLNEFYQILFILLIYQLKFQFNFKQILRLYFVQRYDLNFGCK